MRTSKPTRRSFLKSMFATGAAPWFVPAHVLGANGQTTPSNKITVGVIGHRREVYRDCANLLGWKSSAPTQTIS